VHHCLSFSSEPGALSRFNDDIHVSCEDRINLYPAAPIRLATRRFESASFPALSLDNDDSIYVTWELFPSRRSYSQGLGFSYSSDGGRTFASPSVIPGSVDPALGVNGSQQGLLMRKLAVNGAGAIAVVNSTFKKNQASHIWLTRGQAPGR
jgi:hypothetical protein